MTHASCSMRSASRPVAAGRVVLIATVRSSERCTAVRTMPMPPSPMTAPTASAEVDDSGASEIFGLGSLESATVFSLERVERGGPDAASATAVSDGPCVPRDTVGGSALCVGEDGGGGGGRLRTILRHLSLDGTLPV